MLRLILVISINSLEFWRLNVVHWLVLGIASMVMHLILKFSFIPLLCGQISLNLVRKIKAIYIIFIIFFKTNLVYAARFYMACIFFTQSLFMDFIIILSCMVIIKRMASSSSCYLKFVIQELFLLFAATVAGWVAQRQLLLIIRIINSICTFS